MLPQFLILGLIFGMLTFGWLSVCTLLIARAAAYVQRTHVQRALSSITGLALMGLALKVATERD